MSASLKPAVCVVGAHMIRDVEHPPIASYTIKTAEDGGVLAKSRSLLGCPRNHDLIMMRAWLGNIGFQK